MSDSTSECECGLVVPKKDIKKHKKSKRHIAYETEVDDRKKQLKTTLKNINAFLESASSMIYSFQDLIGRVDSLISIPDFPDE